MFLVLALGLPGFALLAWLTLPWSGLALAAWGLALWLLLRRRRTEPPEPGASVARAIAVVILLFAAVFVTWLSYRWHALPSALLFWAGPALLAAIAVWAGREHAFHGRRRVAIFVPLLAYQIQLMIYGMLYSIGSIMAGSSPI